MAFFRSSRDRRIDRALSSVLAAVDDAEESDRFHCRTWRELDCLSIRMNGRRNKAYDRATNLRIKWHARVERDE